MRGEPAAPKSRQEAPSVASAQPDGDDGSPYYWRGLACSKLRLLVGWLARASPNAPVRPCMVPELIEYMKVFAGRTGRSAGEQFQQMTGTKTVTEPDDLTSVRSRLTTLLLPEGRWQMPR